MSPSTGTVVFEDATLKAVELVAETMTLNNFSVSSTTSLQQATNTGNVTTNTVEFTNPTTAFVTTANVEVGTANLFVDTVSGRVGIGITNPIAKLHVNGNFYAPGSVVQVQSLETKDSYTTTNASTTGATDDTGIKHSITPKFSTSNILVNFNFLAYLNNQSSSTPNGARIQVKRKINGLSQTTVYGTITGHDLHCYLGNPVSLHSYINVSFIDSPNTTGVVEYELGARLYAASGGLDIGNASNQPITIILSEIAV